MQHIGDIAGRLIADFYQEAGFAVLEPLTRDSNLKIRTRAYCGIGDLASLAKNKTTRRHAHELLKRWAEIETDEELRRWIAVSIQISAKKNR